VALRVQGADAGEPVCTQAHKTKVALANQVSTNHGADVTVKTTHHMNGGTPIVSTETARLL
jgi:hypothetical protein